MRAGIFFGRLVLLPSASMGEGKGGREVNKVTLVLNIRKFLLHFDALFALSGK